MVSLLTVKAGDGPELIQFDDLDTYVQGVVPREMPALWPLEALKAQAVCARTFAAVAIGRPRHKDANLCNKPHCQVWTRATHPRTDQAISETAGLVLWYLPPKAKLARLAQAFFSSRCGGHTGLWVSTDKTIDQAAALLAPRLATPEAGHWKGAWNPGAAPWCQPVECICPSVPDWAGRTRQRYGHGVGLCQWGARVMAGGGVQFQDILHHYYHGVVLARIDEPPDPAAFACTEEGV